MKKDIIIGLLTIVSIISLAYGYYQKERADEQGMLAIGNARMARDAAIEAEKQRKIAEQQIQMSNVMMVEAAKQRQSLEEALSRAKSKK